MDLTINENTCLKDLIRIEKNVISDELCDEIINEYKDDLFYEAGVLEEEEMSRKWRNCGVIKTSNPENLKINNRRKEIDNIIYESVTKYGFSFLSSLNATGKINSDSGYDLLKYEEGQYYKEHFDECSLYTKENGEIVNESMVKRKLTYIIQLNDDFEGGGLSFWGDTYRIKIEKGSALMFPPYYLFPHQVLPVTKGIRYSLITWLF
jgi:predicted 2-oxoglutarate/Fe(II)-dependent dioxygenase YbiX